MAAKDSSAGLPAQTYAVELLFAEPPQPNREVLLARLREHVGEVQSPAEGKAALQFFFPGHPVQFSEGELPAQLALLASEKPYSVTPEALSDLQQSWLWTEASDALRPCRYSLLLTDLMSSLLPYQKRIELFCAGLRAVLEALPCQALHWRPSGQFVDPARFLAGRRESLLGERLYGVINVRFYNITDTGERLMDSLGLASLGLRDVQCHFRELDPGEVARALFNTAWYLYERGDVIEDGHTVPGLAASDKWGCAHRQSLVAPERRVIDLDPGPRYSAGDDA